MLSQIKSSALYFILSGRRWQHKQMNCFKKKKKNQMKINVEIFLQKTSRWLKKMHASLLGN